MINIKHELFFSATLMVLLAPAFFIGSVGQNTRSEMVKKECQPIADQGNGYYLNPIFAGNFGDPSLVRVEEDYYIAFSRSNGMMIFHSRDLVNWEPVVRHRLPKGYNTVWAIDLQYFNGKFHVYMPIREYPGKKQGTFGNFVIRSEKPEGPWSAPINLEIQVPEGDYSGIDPGFVQTPEGEKYLYVNHGWAMKLNEEGTKAVSKPELVYEGWQYPEEWVVECMCLESPKLFYRDGYYYLVSAEGGTSGPSTAHMSVVARAKHPLGPWKNSPYNPLTHTYDHDEKFWHQGHGTVFEAADGSWWTVYHGRRNGYAEMGRSTLLMPIEWTKDGWPVEKNGLLSSALIPKPDGENLGHGFPLSDNFDLHEPGMQWYFDNEEKDLLQFGNGKLVMKASGKGHREGTEIYQYATNISFEVTIKVEGGTPQAISGIKLGYHGIATDGEKVFFTEGPNWRLRNNIYPIKNTGMVWMKLKNYRKDVSLYYSEDGENWQKFNASIRSHDSYRITLFASGDGEVIFKNFSYQGLER